MFIKTDFVLSWRYAYQFHDVTKLSSYLYPLLYVEHVSKRKSNTITIKTTQSVAANLINSWSLCKDSQFLKTIIQVCGKKKYLLNDCRSSRGTNYSKNAKTQLEKKYLLLESNFFARLMWLPAFWVISSQILLSPDGIENWHVNTCCHKLLPRIPIVLFILFKIHKIRLSFTPDLYC